MSELVERVARALAEADTNPVYGGLRWDAMPDDEAGADYDSKSYWRGLARAAIEAIREPTPRGWKWELVPDYPTGEVVGPCICGSWPGGKCFKCPPLTTPKQEALE